jgi:hypothetical protein
MIVRIDPALHDAVSKLAERLASETRSEYSRSAVTRGLIALGLVAVADVQLLAPRFIGARLKRGRKRGALAASPDARADRDAMSETEPAEDCAR